MLDGIGASVAWAVLQRRGEAMETRFAAQKTNAADADRFRARATAIASVEDLLKDRRSLTMVLEAFQMESEVDKRAVIRKLLTENPADQASFANRMADHRYREINAAFGGRSGAPLASPALVERIIQRTMVNRFEKAAGEGNAGLREALYFQRSIAAVGSIPALMSDTALVAVAKGALGLPSQFGLLDYDQQKALLTRRLDPATFTDAKAMDRLIQRYLVQAGGSSTGTDWRVSLLSGSGGSSLPGFSLTV